MPSPISAPCFSNAVPAARRAAAWLVAIFVLWAAGRASAQDPAERRSPQAATGAGRPDKQGDGDEAARARYARLSRTLSGAVFQGTFTTDGKPGSSSAERYEIRSARKLPQGNRWLLRARIRYGKIDLTLPLVIDIVWAGETPVITLDRLTIPGLGTFSARVLLHEGRYAGTWQHDAVGGHLFGTIRKLPADRKQNEPREQEK